MLKTVLNILAFYKHEKNQHTEGSPVQQKAPSQKKIERHKNSVRCQNDNHSK